MKPARFFVLGRREPGETVALDGSDAHKIVSVLRLHDGDAVEIIDSAAQRFAAAVSIEGHDVRVRLERLREEEDETQRVAITIAQGIPKGAKMDFVVEKLTELGVDGIVPIYSERSIPSDVGAAKIERWRRVAKSASQQSGRNRIPEIADPLPFNDLIQSFSRYDVVLFPWELAEQAPLRDRLPALVEHAKTILVVIGPEGGFAHSEAEAAERAGAAPISLGRRLLRTETAGMVVASILNFVIG